ncbi:MAG TPA: IS200/IS605 family transposase [Vicinamibacteria bacterium]|nr:IS200/IS605 family transposase [Vicinamibacteria bacterium]
MQQYETLAHCKWECKYHVVFIPKYRKKVLYDNIRKRVGQILRQLAAQKAGVEILEGHLMPDHVHMLLSVPPKYAVASVIGYLKGKSAIWIFREFEGKRRNFGGMHFWARGYFVSTVGRDEQTVREYIKHQEDADKRLDQLQLL